MGPSTPGVHFRTATAADVDDVVRLLAEDAIGPDEEQEPDREVDAAAVQRAFAAIAADPAHELVVATLDGRVVGCMQLTTMPSLTYSGGTRLQIEGVRVAAGLRSRGIGAAMVRLAVERARASGCHLVQLTSNAERVDARRFYERLGFRPTHVGLKLHLPQS